MDPAASLSALADIGNFMKMEPTQPVSMSGSTLIDRLRHYRSGTLTVRSGHDNCSLLLHVVKETRKTIGRILPKYFFGIIWHFVFNDFIHVGSIFVPILLRR